MEKLTDSVDDWLTLNDDAEGTLAVLDDAITSAMPDQERALWVGTFWGGTHQEIIGYGAIRQKQSGGRQVDWFQIGIARQKDHFSIYVSAVDDGQYLAKRYAAELGKVKTGAANITFKRLGDLDFDGLRRLIQHAAALLTDEGVA